MSDADLVARLQQALIAARRRAFAWWLPDRFLDELAHGLAAIHRDLAREAAAPPTRVVTYTANGRTFQCVTDEHVHGPMCDHTCTTKLTRGFSQ